MARRTIAGLRAIVTGASSGIGRELVRELIRRQARVVALARREDRLRELAAEIAAPDLLRWMAGDVTSPADRAAALGLCVADFGGLDCLVNNAGLGARGPFAQADEARLRLLFEVNFFAPAQFLREALPHLRQGRDPLVVNVGSVLGHRAVPEKSEYCASKFALHGLSDSLRCELGREGIDVLLVSPSTTSSEFFERSLSDQPPPVRRWGVMTPQAVARCTVDAMCRGRREIILSAGGKFLVWLDRLCPPLADWLVGRF
jgi:short-subunit dehydrogenase